MTVSRFTRERHFGIVRTSLSDFTGSGTVHPNNDLRWVSIDIGMVISHDALHFQRTSPSILG